MQDLAALRDPSEGDAPIVLGAGQYEFQPVRDGGLIGLFHGPQGGFHFPLNAKISGMKTGVPTDFSSGPLSLFSVLDESGTALSYFPCAIKYPYVATDNGMFALARPEAMVIPNARVPDIYGHTVTVGVEIVDDEGHYAIAHARVIVEPYLPPIRHDDGLGHLPAEQ